MSHLYERPAWIAQAKGLDKSSSVFSMIVHFFGFVGILTSIGIFAMSFVMIDEGGLFGMGAAAILFIQSVFIIAFGSMMRRMSQVILSVFEMSLSETREQIAPEQ